MACFLLEIATPSQKGSIFCSIWCLVNILGLFDLFGLFGKNGNASLFDLFGLFGKNGNASEVVY